MELLYRFEGTLAQPAPIGPVAEGLRIDIPFAGRIADGSVPGGRAWGNEYLLQRADGVGVIDARDTIEIPGGYLHAQARGYLEPPPGAAMPSIEEMLDPGFVPPDVPLTIHAYAMCHTGVPEYAHLNRTLVKVDGWVNNATGELVFKGRAVASVPAYA